MLLYLSMKAKQNIPPLIFLIIFCLICPLATFAKESSATPFPSGESSDWMGTYFKGKKLGFSFAKMKVTKNGITVNSKSFFRLKSEGVNQSTTFNQVTHLTPDLRLREFSLAQEILGQRQKVDAHIENRKLVYRVVGLGFDKTQSIPFHPNTAPSSTFLLKIIRDGIQVGKQGKIPIFMEAFQMLVDLEYEILRTESIKYDDKPVETFVILHQVAGMVSTLWVTANGTVIKEITSQGFESHREPEHIARDLGDEVMTVGSLITLSLVKPGREIPHPSKKRRMKMILSKMRSPDLIPEDHRQKVLQSKKSADGTYTSVLLVNSEPKKLARSLPRPVSGFDHPEFLDDSAEVQSKHPLIRNLAKELVGETSNAWKASKQINLWVYNYLEKELVDSVSALNALNERKGECQSHTYLFTALARAAGIPTRIVNGLVYSSQLQGFLYHAWPEVYVGEWRTLDPTFGQDIVDATHIKLSQGEKESQFKLMEFIGKIQIELIKNE